MSAIAFKAQFSASPGGVVRTNLLELMIQLSRMFDDEDQIVEAAEEMLRSGHVVLTGNFSGREADLLGDPPRAWGRSDMSELH